MTIDRTDYLLALVAACLAIGAVLFVSGGHPILTPDGAGALHVAQNIVDGEGLVFKRTSEKLMGNSGNKRIAEVFHYADSGWR
ncbi:hypothetical protein N9H39_00940 [Gammaproteobacteria bacterium]|nr:hypothetical protein [Gammaproteobacteria bacterium]